MNFYLIVGIIAVHVYLLFSSFLSGLLIKKKIYPDLSLVQAIVFAFIIFNLALPLIVLTTFSFQLVAYLHLFSTFLSLLYLLVTKQKVLPSISEGRVVFTVLLVSVSVFFYPFLHRQKMGIFTEGGGDITIYQNLANNIPDNSLFAGNKLAHTFIHLKLIYNQLQSKDYDSNKTYLANIYQKLFNAKSEYERVLGFDEANYYIGTKFNPPYFWEHERLHGFFGSINDFTGWILPQGYLHKLFRFFPIGIVYFSVLSFIYFLYILLISDFVWNNTHSKVKTFTISFVFLCSHAFIYPAYNHYYPAWVTGLIFLFCLLLFIEPKAKLFSLEINILLSFVVLAVYWPFWIFFLINIFFYLLLTNDRIHKIKELVVNGLWVKLVFIVTLSPFLVIGLNIFITFLLGFFAFDTGGSGHFKQEYMGISAVFFTSKVLLSVLGFFQLGNIAPYSSDYLFSSNILEKSAWMGISCIGLFFGIVIFCLRDKLFLKNVFLLLIVYFSILISSQGNLYNQYKALSYGLVIVYLLLAIGLIIPKKKYLDTLLIILLILFSFNLFSFRATIMGSIINETNRESFLNYGEFNDVIDEKNQDSVYIIEPHKVSSIFLLETMIGNVKHLFARETFYYSQIKTSFSEVINHFQLQNFFYLRKENGAWTKTTLKQKIEKEGLVYLAPAYFENDKLLIEGEIFFLPNKNLNITVKPQDCQIPKLKLWNPADKKYIPVVHISENKQLCEFQFSIPASYDLNSVLIEGRNFVKIQ
jgi:hypothetical protein